MGRHWTSIPHTLQHNGRDHPLGPHGIQRIHEYNHHPHSQPQWLDTATTPNYRKEWLTHTNNHPPHTIQYKPTPKWPQYYHYVDPSLVSIICIRSQTNLGPNLQTPHKLPHILKQITNTHIDTYPIKPTILNYRVKFSYTWKTHPEITSTQQKPSPQYPYPLYTTTNTPSNTTHNNASTPMDHLFVHLKTQRAK